MKLTVMNYNIHHGQGTDRVVSLDRIAEAIGSAGADLIGLNEVDRHFSRRSGFRDQVAILAESLGMHYVFSPAISFMPRRSGGPVRQYGNALLSRFPLGEKRSSLLPRYWKVDEARSLLSAVLPLEPGPVHIYVTHLSINPFNQLKQMEYLRDTLQREESPALLVGDFNMLPGTRPWRMIAGVMQDVCHTGTDSAPQGCKTYPAARPGRQLDYIFASSHFRVLSSQSVQGTLASDHLPIKAVLELQ